MPVHNQLDFPHIDFNKPWREVLDRLYDEPGFMDSVSIQVHEIRID